MKEIGEDLRKAREKKQLSLKDIQEITKIRLQYLEAMENGDFEVIPGEVYRKGFLVNFANTVGIDGQQLLEKYYQLKNLPMEQPLNVEEKKVVTGTVNESKPKTTRIRLKNKANLWVGISIVVLVVAGFAVGPMIKERTIATDKIQKTLDETPARKPVPVVPVKKDKKETVVTTQVYPAPITLYAEFSDRVWVQVKADGEYVYMENGITFTKDSPKQVWTAQKELEIRVGNSGGVKFTFNGRSLGEIGEHGMSKTYKFNPEGLIAP